MTFSVFGMLTRKKTEEIMGLILEIKNAIDVAIFQEHLNDFSSLPDNVVMHCQTQIC